MTPRAFLALLLITGVVVLAAALAPRWALAAPTPVVIDAPTPPALDRCLTVDAVLSATRPDAVHAVPLPSGITVMTLWRADVDTWLTVLFSPRGCALHSMQSPIAQPPG